MARMDVTRKLAVGRAAAPVLLEGFGQGNSRPDAPAGRLLIRRILAPLHHVARPAMPHEPVERARTFVS